VLRDRDRELGAEDMASVDDTADDGSGVLLDCATEELDEGLEDDITEDDFEDDITEDDREVAKVLDDRTDDELGLLHCPKPLWQVVALQ
jgi:hypothetical protein